MGGSAPGAELHEEGMGSSYQALCIAQEGLQPWPFAAVMEDVDDDAEEVVEAEAAPSELQQQPEASREPR